MSLTVNGLSFAPDAFQGDTVTIVRFGISDRWNGILIEMPGGSRIGIPDHKIAEFITALQKASGDVIDS